jgi:hypothetical protein
VFTVYLFSAMFITIALLFATEAAADKYLAMVFVQVGVLLYGLVYFVVALRTNYQQGWIRSILKSLALLFLFLPILGAAIELVSHTGGGGMLE